MDGQDTLAYLRKEALDLYNRLHSIEEDITFVNQLHDAYPIMPLLPNLRCGAWYVNPEISAKVPAYFKSTDGHNNNWSFNLRRANLHLLPHVIEFGGLILVDSTRSGKRIPDALSKTVPIWCAVINRAMLILHPYLRERGGSHKKPWDSALYTPPTTVSKLEHHEIEKRLDGWAEALAASSFILPPLTRPLRPVWITPATTTFPSLPSCAKLDEKSEGDFLPIICVSASRQIDQGVERRSSGFSYVQGSGDDHELWGMGLTPDIFWAHRQRLLSADRTHLPGLVGQILSTASNEVVSMRNSYEAISPIAKVQGRLLIGAIPELPNVSSRIATQDQVVYVILTSSQDVSPNTDPDPSLFIPAHEGKKGQSHFLLKVLPPSVDFIGRNLRSGRSVCIVCETGKDLSVGVALVALQLFFADDGSFVPQEGDADDQVNKASVRTRLEWLIASRPQANPSRATLKRVNEYLLTSRLFAQHNGK